jgi:hypothetical protein
LHWIASISIQLHLVALNSIEVPELHWIALKRCDELRRGTSLVIALNCIELHRIASYCIGLHWIASISIQLHWNALYCIGLHWIASISIQLHWIALNCIELHELHWIALKRCDEPRRETDLGIALNCIELH